MNITFLGHSAMLVAGGERRVIIDPFLTGNPAAAMPAAEVKVDAVILTHAHGDHFGDAIDIAKANDCPIFAIVELAGYCKSKGVKTHGMNLGGSFEENGIRVQFTPALHSSSIQENGTLIYAGTPAGVVLTMGGKTLYHAGDTALFSDLKLVGRRVPIDVAALPIGDYFTMGPEDALDAASLIGAKHVIPVHYNTFPPIRQDGEAFVKRLEAIGIAGHALKPGETLTV
ncbi:metal-dependent hydrolase [Paenibacillus thermotolerans]|uniref:metal-dependent hydrolase n=1 Tax=Paenibacillus thermotolerans TaxID=3027807 RepID=UPI002368365E|nr:MULTISPECIES: metal-dependent hydrolase [unclassified Paenibacillus]